MFWVVLLFASGIAAAEDHCSLRVEVTNARGYKLTGVMVTLLESNGRADAGTTKDGEAKFCGLGISPVTVTAGGDCGQVSVRNVPLVWGQERLVRVVYDREPCLLDQPRAPGCSILLRFVDEAGKAVPAVRFDRLVGKLNNAQSDSFGRTMLRLAPDESVTVGVSAVDYKSESVSLKCATGHPSEVIAILKRSR